MPAVRFRAVSLKEAVALARERAAAIAALPDALRPVMSPEERLMRADIAGNVVDALSE